MKGIEGALRLIRCQQCLSELRALEGELACASCGRRYPLADPLIYMGYDREARDEIQSVIEHERDHQTDLADVQQHYDYAPSSFKIGLICIDLLRDLIGPGSPVALDIGSGGAPFSLILAERGFDTYRLELDPNSLTSGLFWEHPGLGPGKHIVADAAILPFESGSVDVVFCKEFIHHVRSYPAIFREINRVLKPDGIFLMMEPTTKFAFLRSKADHEAMSKCGHHLRSAFDYGSELRESGFEILRYYLYYRAKSRRIKVLNRIKRHFNRQIYRRSETSSAFMPFKMVLQRVISGQSIFYARKNRSPGPAGERPEIEAVRPEVMQLDEDYLTDPRLLRFKEILAEVTAEVARGDYGF